MGYPTPSDLPVGTLCRQIFIPDDPLWLAVYGGLISSLADPHIWEIIGTLTPEEAAERAAEVYYQFVDEECNPPPVPNYTEGVRVRRTSTTTLFSTTMTAIGWQAERYDTDSMWTSGTPVRITITTAGKYVITGNVQFAAFIGTRGLQIRRSGSEIIAYVDDVTTTSVVRTIGISTIFDLAAGDYLELMANQSSAGAVNLNVVASYVPEFMAQRIG